MTVKVYGVVKIDSNRSDVFVGAVDVGVYAIRAGNEFFATLVALKRDLAKAGPTMFSHAINSFNE